MDTKLTIAFADVSVHSFIFSTQENMINLQTLGRAALGCSSRIEHTVRTIDKTWSKGTKRRVFRLVVLMVLVIMMSCFTNTGALFIRVRRVSPEEVTSQLVKLINEERRNHDKAPVCTNMKLMRASQIMAEDMADSDYFAGTGDDTSSPAERVGEQRFVFTTLVEDVAAGYESAKDALDALLSVKEHRENILGDYAFVGAGYSYGRRTGYKHFWSLHFANAIKEYCDRPVQKKVEEQASFFQRWFHH